MFGEGIFGRGRRRNMCGVIKILAIDLLFSGALTKADTQTLHSSRLQYQGEALDWATADD